MCCSRHLILRNPIKPVIIIRGARDVAWENGNLVNCITAIIGAPERHSLLPQPNLITVSMDSKFSSNSYEPVLLLPGVCSSYAFDHIWWSLLRNVRENISIEKGYYFFHNCVDATHLNLMNSLLQWIVMSIIRHDRLIILTVFCVKCSQPSSEERQFF